MKRSSEDYTIKVLEMQQKFNDKIYDKILRIFSIRKLTCYFLKDEDLMRIINRVKSSFDNYSVFEQDYFISNTICEILFYS